MVLRSPEKDKLRLDLSRGRACLAGSSLHSSYSHHINILYMKLKVFFLSTYPYLILRLVMFLSNYTFKTIFITFLSRPIHTRFYAIQAVILPSPPAGII